MAVPLLTTFCTPGTDEVRHVGDIRSDGSGPAPGSADGTGPESGVVQAAPHDAGVDCDLKPDTAGHDESTGSSIPSAFRIVNATSHPVYFETNDWLPERVPYVGCRRESDAGTPGPYPWCMFSTDDAPCIKHCAAVEQGADCILYTNCSLSMRAFVLGPCESFERRWDGTIYTSDFTHCSQGECLRQDVAPAGDYTALLQYHDDVECKDLSGAPADCQEDEPHLISGGPGAMFPAPSRPAGNAGMATAAFSIPTTASVIELWIQ